MNSSASSELRILRFENSDQLLSQLATDFAATCKQLKSSLSRRPRIVLTGGRLGLGLAKKLAESNSGFDPEGLWICWGDERFVAHDSSDSNSGETIRAMPSLQRATVWRFPIAEDLPRSVSRAERELSVELAPVEDELLFDLVLLGIGEDGHVASIFPSSEPKSQSIENLVMGVADSPKPPQQRLSLSERALNRSHRVWFLASGTEKQLAVRGSTEGDRALPAGRIRGFAETTWYLDEASLAE